MVHSVYKTGIAVALAAGCALSSQALGQSVEFVLVIKLKLHEQTSATSVQLFPPEFLPFGIDMDVAGTDIEFITPPTVSGPITNPEPSHNGGVLGFNTQDENWLYGWPNFNNWGSETLGALDSLFGSGTYTFNVTGVNVALTLTGDVYPGSPPLLTLTGGDWADGVYVIDADSQLTITTSAYPEYGSHVDDAISVGLWGPDFSADDFQLASQVPTNSMSLTVPASTLTPGEDYAADSSFTAVVDVQFVVAGLPDAIAAAGYDQTTLLIVRVNPLPCPADLTGSVDPNSPDFGLPDGLVDANDFFYFLDRFAAGDLATADLTGSADPNSPDFGVPDGILDANDFFFYLVLFAQGC